MRNRGNSVCPTAFTGHSLGLSPSPISLFLLNLWPISVSGLSFEIVHWVQSHWGRVTRSYTQWDCPNSVSPGNQAITAPSEQSVQSKPWPGAAWGEPHPPVPPASRFACGTLYLVGVLLCLATDRRGGHVRPRQKLN